MKRLKPALSPTRAQQKPLGQVLQQGQQTPYEENNFCAFPNCVDLAERFTSHDRCGNTSGHESCTDYHHKRSRIVQELVDNRDANRST